MIMHYLIFLLLSSSGSFEESEGTDEGSLDALMRDYDGLNATPPRTRIHRRQLKKNSLRYIFD